MDESGEQFVAYFLPTEETLEKRREDFANQVPYQDDEEYEYKMAREYNWNVKSKASRGYEENYFFVVRQEGIYYNELETRVRLNKRRQKVGQAPSNTRLCVKHRPMDANEFRLQRYREKQLEPPGEMNFVIYWSTFLITNYRIFHQIVFLVFQIRSIIITLFSY